jgi:hypothetical protein
MSRILTSFLLLYWATVFSLLAALALFGGEGGVMSGFSFFGVALSGADYVASLPALKAAVAFGFSICAVLFWWSFVTAAAGNRIAADEVIRLAFAGACCLTTVMLLVGSLKAPNGLFFAMAGHLAALIASFVAVVGTEQKIGERRGAQANEELSLTARVTADDVSQTARLYRFAPSFDGGRSLES